MLINGEYAYKLKLALKYMWQDYVRFTLTTCVTSVTSTAYSSGAPVFRIFLFLCWSTGTRG
jgi:hypothetical protein